MRGEHALGVDDDADLLGSSPHARGARAPYNMIGSSLGIIPAYAGSTSGTRPPACPCRIIPAYAGSTRRHRAWYRALRDHPRMRGEHIQTYQACKVEGGSSPHAQGAQVQGRIPVQGQGIIPACAGSTRRCRTSPARWWDHPRMRGEHIASRKLPVYAPGSSPHARGALGEGVFVQCHIGIIPACAGSTQSF